MSAYFCPFVEQGSSKPQPKVAHGHAYDGDACFADDDDYLLAMRAHCNRPMGGHDDDRAGLVANTYHHLRKDGRVVTLLIDMRWSCVELVGASIY